MDGERMMLWISTGCCDYWSVRNFFFFWFAAPWDRSFHLDAPRTPEKSPKLSSMAALNHNISVINSCNDDGNSIGRPVRRGDPRRPEETRGNPRRAEESDRVRRKIEVTGEEARGAEESRGEPMCLAESDRKRRWPEKRREEPGASRGDRWRPEGATTWRKKTLEDGRPVVGDGQAQLMNKFAKQENRNWNISSRTLKRYGNGSEFPYFLEISKGNVHNGRLWDPLGGAVLCVHLPGSTSDICDSNAHSSFSRYKYTYRPLTISTLISQASPWTDSHPHVSFMMKLTRTGSHEGNESINSLLQATSVQAFKWLEEAGRGGEGERGGGWS